MFDIGWSELLILGIVTLVMVGPKELPVFLRTIGKYVAMLRTQAAEFRAHFDAAMRETELDQIRKDMAGLRDDVTGTVRSATAGIENDLRETGRSLDETARSTTAPLADPVVAPAVREPDFTDENGLPAAAPPAPAAPPAEAANSNEPDPARSTAAGHHVNGAAGAATTPVNRGVDG
ncbi:MAG: Sec-independent protein translocase protein TatB [Hyphomicrobiaceae bacterium]|nr:Sec-independent protein translocase protein TatB [Hyphomicrobiaceae bacterium]